MASYSDPFFEPASLSKAQLEGVLQSFSEIVAEIAKYCKRPDCDGVKRINEFS